MPPESSSTASRRRSRRRARSSARSTAAPTSVDPVEAGEDRQVVLDRDVDVEVVELGDDAHLRPRRLRVARQLVAEHAQLARVGDRLPGEQPHRRRLAGAVGAEQAEADALGHVEVEPVDRRDRAEALDHAA